MKRGSGVVADPDRKDLPKNWINARFLQITNKAKKIAPEDTPNKLFYYCDISSIDNKKFQIVNPKKFMGKDAPSRARQLIQKDDILFSTVRTYLRNIAIVPDNLDGQLASTGFCVIRTIPEVIPQFVFYYVLSEQFLHTINIKQIGVNYPAIRNNDIMNSIICLPPFLEQRRIVSKIESIFSQIDAAKKELEILSKVSETNFNTIHGLKLNILKIMFNGKFTEHWRNKNNLQIKKYSKIISNIDSDFDEFGRILFSTMPAIPSNWSWVRLHKISKLGQGGTPSRSKSEFWNGKIHWLRSGEVRNNIIKNTNERITKIGLKNSSTTMCPVGSVLLAMTGEGLTRGRTAILEINSCANQSVCHMIPNNKFIINRYLFYYLQSIYYRIRLLDKGSNQPGLNVSIIKNFEIPICTIIEQKYIVSKIESIFAKIDSYYLIVICNLRI